VTIPWATQKRQKGMVNKANRDALTEEYRQKAMNRAVPKSLEELQQMVRNALYGGLTVLM
jgi:hypothetical protein